MIEACAAHNMQSSCAIVHGEDETLGSTCYQPFRRCTRFSSHNLSRNFQILQKEYSMPPRREETLRNGMSPCSSTCSTVIGPRMNPYGLGARNLYPVVVRSQEKTRPLEHTRMRAVCAVCKAFFHPSSRTPMRTACSR